MLLWSFGRTSYFGERRGELHGFVMGAKREVPSFFMSRFDISLHGERVIPVSFFKGEIVILSFVRNFEFVFRILYIFHD